MKKTIRIIALLAIVVITALSVNGCDMLAEMLVDAVIYDISGDAIDVKDDTVGYLSSISLELQTLDGSRVDSTTTNNDGSFKFSDVEPGEYRVEASSSVSNYAIVGADVVISSEDVTDLEILGFSYDASTYDASTVSIIMMWDGEATDSSGNLIDLDAHITFPSGYKGIQEIRYPIDDYEGSMSDGFLGDDVMSSTIDYEQYGREWVNYYNPTSDFTLADFGSLYSQTDAVIELDRDASPTDFNYPGGPETVSIREMPFNWYSQSWTTSNFYAPASTTMLPSNGDTSEYGWVGVINFYVNAYNGQLMTEGESASQGGAGLEVYVVQGDSVLGQYVVPEYTGAESMKLFRINMLIEDDTSASTYAGDYYVFQIVPDSELVTPGGSSFRPSSDDSGIITVRGAGR